MGCRWASLRSTHPTPDRPRLWTLPVPFPTLPRGGAPLSHQPRSVTSEEPTMSKYVCFFGAGKAEGRADMKDLLGGKGANLAEMTNIGLPVPSGFTLTTGVCTYYYEHGRQYPSELKA